jgi:hypothetical protein
MTMPDFSHCGYNFEDTTCPNSPWWWWTRWGTPAEVELFHSTGDLPMHETTCTISVVGCQEYDNLEGVAPHHPTMDEMTRTHDSDCVSAPCSCSVSDANWV